MSGISLGYNESIPDGFVPYLFLYWYANDILDISLAYHYKKRYWTNPSGIDSLYPRDMRDIYIFNEYSLYIPCLYMVYTWYILRIYMVYTWYIPYSTRWLVLRRRAGVRARAYPPAGQRLHTVTQTRPRARARAHVRTSAHTRAREHLAHARTSARPCKPERASTINGEQGIGPNQMVKKFLSS